VPAALSSPTPGPKNQRKADVFPSSSNQKRKSPKERQKSPQNRRKSKKEATTPFFCVWFLSATSEKQPTPPHHQFTQEGYCPPLAFWLNLITLDYVLRKGTQSNWSGKQARICVLCDASSSHTARRES
jgi:hypothetical protein